MNPFDYKTEVRQERLQVEFDILTPRGFLADPFHIQFNHRHKN